MSVAGEIGVRGYFERPAHTFAILPEQLNRILQDPGNPLYQIVQIIPDGAKVLDVGAGNGVLARLLAHAQKRVQIEAIEPDSAAAISACGYYAEIYPCTVEEFLSRFVESNRHKYDYVVLADVIEHLSNPSKTLHQVRQLINKKGVVVISTPNIAFGAVRVALLGGEFEYVDSGILERTHLRFFTRKTLLAVLESVGLKVQKEIHCLRDPKAMEIQTKKTLWNSFLFMLLRRDPLAAVYQFLIVADLHSCNSATISRAGSSRTSVSIVAGLLARIKVKLLVASK